MHRRAPAARRRFSTCYDLSVRASNAIVRFVVFWAINTLSLWVADELFTAISFTNAEALLVSGLLLGLVNTFVRPILLILTLPFTIVTFGLFLLVLNALMLALVAWLVPGFHLEGLGSGLLIALFVSVLSFFIHRALGIDAAAVRGGR
jgi:putative membrane protein